MSKDGSAEVTKSKGLEERKPSFDGNVMAQGVRELDYGELVPPVAHLGSLVSSDSSGTIDLTTEVISISSDDSKKSGIKEKVVKVKTERVNVKKEGGDTTSTLLSSPWLSRLRSSKRGRCEMSREE